MKERKDDTMELPVGDLEEEKKPRPGPPPLPGQRTVVTKGPEPAESTTPTEIPPPPMPSRPPARLGRSVLPPPPDPKTYKMKSPAEVPTGRDKESDLKSTRRLKFKPGDLPFDEAPKKTPTRPSAPPPPTAAALRLSSKPPALTSKTPSKPPPLTSAISKPPAAPVPQRPVSKPPAPAPIPSTPSTIRTAVTMPGSGRPAGGPATTSAVSEAAKIARIRFLEEELRELKSRIADHTRRVIARLDALEVRVDELRAPKEHEPRSTLLEQRVDEIGEDVEEKLAALETRVVELQKKLDDEARSKPDLEAKLEPDRTMEMVAPPPSLDELEVILRERFEELEATMRAQLAAKHAELEAKLAELASKPTEPAAQKSTAKKATKKDEDSLTTVKGIGPANAKKLRKRGVDSPQAVAAWSDEDIDRLHGVLGIAKKRLRGWRDAAKALA